MIIVRRMPTEPKMTFAGATLEISLARFMASLAASIKERPFSRRFCRLESVSMVETRGGGEKMTWDTGCAKRPEP